MRLDAIKFPFNPFALGVASGSPTADGIVLWTRLVTPTGEPIGMRPNIIPVRWEVAADDRMQSVVRSGDAAATTDLAHSVHVEADGLRPSTDYWYRFTAGGQQSAVGRLRTAPAPNHTMSNIKIAVASCQKYENGYYTAYGQMLADQPDLVIHVGDYIYEYASNASSPNVRGDGSGETRTLDQYRSRYALYKSDPDLLAMHAACTWLMTWDDHEVVNDYAGDTSYDESGEKFLARRAAAYRAYYEHMPLRKTSLPNGPFMRLHQTVQFGELLQIHMLDSRQHRSPLACLRDGETDGPGAQCAELWNAARTKLGTEQESWLKDALAKSHAKWNLCAQGTPMAHVDLDPDPGKAYRRDSWDGYPSARQRFVDTLQTTQVKNPVVIDGDIHAFQVADLNAQADDHRTPIIATEFTTTSITSSGVSQRALDERRANNPNVLLSDSSRHGFLLLNVSAKNMQAELVTVDTIRSQIAQRGTLAKFAVEDGRPGAQSV